ncbi:hypothetical protein GOODEAATRI_005035 [Goodea atripinnis]|uniref:Uncharacterized protein n=1 Tax=Goodea atripinnis TaxID=208336 RepID=A0ABV0MPF7_9TELE
MQGLHLRAAMGSHKQNGVCAQTSRSAEVQPVMALLCLLGTVTAVTFTNAMNQHHLGQVGRPESDQLRGGQIDIRWTGRRDGRGDTENSPRTNNQQKTRAPTDRKPSGL